MKIMSIGVLLLQFALAAAAQSQTFDDVQVVVGVVVTAATGADKNEGIWWTRTPIVIGRPTAAEWSMYGCGLFELSVANTGFKEGSTTGWRVEITPTRVVNRAVTFRLRWVRAIDNGKEDKSAGEDVELTLQPGEARTIDRVPVPPGAKTLSGGACGTSAASLRVSVDYYPSEAFDRRLIAADVWLVEQVPNASARSLPLSVRGLPNRPIPFHFDSITDGEVSLEIFGQLVARPENGALEVVLQARSRWGESPFDWRRRGDWATQWLESAIHVKPEEIVEVPLPKLGERGGPFGNRVFSLRIRARQMR